MFYRDANMAAEFLPQRHIDELPAVRIGDALVFVYYDRDGTLRVTVDTEDADESAEPLNVKVKVNNGTVWEGQDR